jgi:hypothetical protein
MEGVKKEKAKVSNKNMSTIKARHSGVVWCSYL